MYALRTCPIPTIEAYVSKESPSSTVMQSRVPESKLWWHRSCHPCLALETNRIICEIHISSIDLTDAMLFFHLRLNLFVYSFLLYALAYPQEQNIRVRTRARFISLYIHVCSYVPSSLSCITLHYMRVIAHFQKTIVSLPRSLSIIVNWILFSLHNVWNVI